MTQETEGKIKLKSISDAKHKQVAVCIAIQNLGVATVDQIIEKIGEFGGKITTKQVLSITEALQKMQIISVNFNEKDSIGNSVKRYNMRQISTGIPEIGQLKSIVDGRGDEIEEVRALITEFESSKANAKFKPFNYFRISAVLKSYGDIQGFIPDDEGISRFYRDDEGNIIFYERHFQSWLKRGLPLVNRSPNKIIKIITMKGNTDHKGTNLRIGQSYITNVQGNDKGGGRGVRKYEILPSGVKITTQFLVPGNEFEPDSFKQLLELTCEAIRFGGSSKISNGKLMLQDYKLQGKVFAEE